MKVAKVTIQVDEKWGKEFTNEEIAEYLKVYIDSRIGFRGVVKKVLVKEKPA